MGHFGFHVGVKEWLGVLDAPLKTLTTEGGSPGTPGLTDKPRAWQAVRSCVALGNRSFLWVSVSFPVK